MLTPAIETLVRFATDRIHERPAAEQSAIYQAISEVMPDPSQRAEAARLAFAIMETAQLQKDFLPNLFSHSPLTPES